MPKVTEQTDRAQEKSQEQTSNSAQVTPVVQSSVDTVKEDLMHLDDFLNHIESAEKKIETISAFGLLKKAEGAIKKTFDAWLKEFRDFENSTPE